MPVMQPAPVDVLTAAMSADDVHCALARLDPNAFVTYCMRDELNGRLLEQAPLHLVWHELADRHRRLLIWSHVESGKTFQLSISRVLWELGRNPSLRIAIISNTHGQSGKIIRSIARYIESCDELHRVFPGLQPGEPWTGGSLTVQRLTVAKDASVQASGVHGNILGSRIDLLVLDDILDYENCRTEGMRKDLWDWYHATLAGRLTADARILCIGTAFHPDDMLHRFAKQPGWTAVRYPVLDPGTGESRWPDRWPPARITAKAAELGPLEFARQMLCVARDDTEARFKREWIEGCIKRGAEVTLKASLPTTPQGCRVVTGVDLAVQRNDAADYTVLFTVLALPEGTRQVLDIQRGRWAGAEIITRIIETHRRYNSIVIVENNAGMDFIVQFARGSFAVPIRPFTTGRNKMDPAFGVESIAAEMAGGKWVIPSSGGLHPEVERWVNEMLYYDPRAHTGDSLMASWFAREGVRHGEFKVERGHLDLLSR